MWTLRFGRGIAGVAGFEWVILCFELGVARAPRDGAHDLLGVTSLSASVGDVKSLSNWCIFIE